MIIHGMEFNESMPKKQIKRINSSTEAGVRVRFRIGDHHEAAAPPAKERRRVLQQQQDLHRHLQRRR